MVNGTLLGESEGVSYSMLNYLSLPNAGYLFRRYSFCQRAEV